MEKYKVFMIAKFDGKVLTGWMNDHGYPCTDFAKAAEVTWEEATGMINHTRSFPDCEAISNVNFQQINAPVFWTQPQKRVH